MLRQILNANVIRHGHSVLVARSICSTPAMQQTFKNYEPNGLEKRLLVWGGKYKSVEDIPSHISQEEMERVRNRMRIRLANIMMALTVVGCAIMVYSGKQAAKRGESVSKQNLEWHAKYNAATNDEKSTSTSN